MKGLLTDERGIISHKRVVAMTCTVILCTVFLVNAVFPKTVTPSTPMIDALTYIIIACIAGSSADKFSYKKPIDKPADESVQS